MPRKTKELNTDEAKPKTTVSSKAKKTTSTTKTKKTASKNSSKVAKNTEKVEEKKTLKKDSNKKTTSKETTKKATTKKTSKKETSTKKTTAKKTTTTKKTKASSKKIPDFSPEYYDLPFKYNKTVVKILAQTPTNLFVYWEISDEDREKLKNQFGEYFFEITKPVLIVYNETLNYSFEVDIDDFANSWYLHVDDSNSEYKIELGRRPIPVNYNYMPEYDLEKQGPIKPLEIPYIYISSSNELEAPNDRILFNNTKTIYFRNVKTNQIIKKDIKEFPNIYKNGKFTSIHKIYKHLYKDEIFNDELILTNPSSGNPSSGSFSIRYN